MSENLKFHRLLVLLGALAAAPWVPAQDADPTYFSDAQLEQMAAPIALYPDALLMQILMAATYPLEVIQAHRLLEANPHLSGAALDEELRHRAWDPSVKSLCQFRDLLKRMNDNLDWTKDLGDAFLGQQAALLDAVQRLRTAAYEAGSLRPSPEQEVMVKEDRIIVIEPRTEVVYVPVYYPIAVYGPAWRFPRWYYPPLFLPPPPGPRPFVTFSAGFVIGSSLWSVCTWGWGRHAVDINIVRYRDFNRNTCARPDRYMVWKDARDRGPWQHFPDHRHGVNYRDPRVAEQYGRVAGPGWVSRDQARGYSRPPTATGPGPGVPGPTTGRPGAGRSITPSGSRQPALGPTKSARGTTSRSTGTSAVTRPSSGTSSGASRNTAFSGSRQPALDRAASVRGSASRSTGTSSPSAAARGSGSTSQGQRK